MKYDLNYITMIDHIKLSPNISPMFLVEKDGKTDVAPTARQTSYTVSSFILRNSLGTFSHRSTAQQHYVSRKFTVSNFSRMLPYTKCFE